MEPWNGWYHVTSNTYGTWLPGDPRGWRVKRHRKHVEGDYKNPPPNGTDRPLLEHARGKLKQPPVRLDPTYREIAGKAVVDMLAMQEIEILALSMDAIHCHLLGRFGDKSVRPRVGRAKKHATFCLREHGHAGRVWEAKGRALPITDRAHQVNVFNYIVDHGLEGAWVWTYRQGLHWRDET